MKHLSAQKKPSHSSASHTAYSPQEGVLWLHCSGSVFPSVRQRAEAGSQQETDSVRIGHDSQIIHSGESACYQHAAALYMSCLKNIGPSICEPTLQGKRVARNECPCMKGRSVEGKGRVGLPSHLTCLDKLQGNIMNIDPLLKLCSVDLSLYWYECSHSASRTLPW